jgi:hypothetical protein
MLDYLTTYVNNLTFYDRLRGLLLGLREIVEMFGLKFKAKKYFKNDSEEFQEILVYLANPKVRLKMLTGLVKNEELKNTLTPFKIREYDEDFTNSLRRDDILGLGAKKNEIIIQRMDRLRDFITFKPKLTIKEVQANIQGISSKLRAAAFEDNLQAFLK